MYRGYYAPPRYGISSQYHQRFPQDIELVFQSDDPNRGNIFVSNLQAAENHQTIQKHNIRAILSCAKGYKIDHPKQLVPEYLYIPAEDRPSYDLTPYFEQCVDFINNNLEHHNVLVHCMAGVSRSVSMVLAYLMRQHKMTYDQAYYAVKNRRNIINPNEGFISQLRAYQQRLRKSSSRSRRQQYSTPQTSRRHSAYAFQSSQYPFSKSNYYDDFFSYSNKQNKDYHNNTVTKFQAHPKQPVKINYSNMRASWGPNPENQRKSMPHFNKNSSCPYDRLYSQVQSKVQKIRQKYDMERQKLITSRRNSSRQSPLPGSSFNKTYNNKNNSFTIVPKSTQNYYPSPKIYQTLNHQDYDISYRSRFNRPYNSRFY